MINRNKVLHLFLLFIPLVSLMLLSGTTMYYKPQKYEKIANQITQEAAATIRKKYHLDLVGSGGAMMGNVQMMALSFNCYRPLSIDQGRQLIVNCVDNYMISINGNEDIRPFLSNYPFDARNIELAIACYENKNFKELNPGKVSTISALNGKIYYYTKKSLDEYTLDILLEEDYEDAVRIVKEQGRLE